MITLHDGYGCIVSSDQRLSSCLTKLEAADRKILLVVDEGRLVGTVTDGDIRRGMLRGVMNTSLITAVMNPSPIVIAKNTRAEEALSVLRKAGVSAAPVVNQNEEVEGIWCRTEKSNLLETVPLVIMAGGRGKRLMPHTESTPKPMLEMYGKPMLEHLVLRARNRGFKKVFISVGYLSNVIKTYFEDGRNFDVEICYLEETLPLGTAGSLKQLENQIENDFVVVNGDVLTPFDYAELLSFHFETGAVATMGVLPQSWENPFGVIELKGYQIESIIEKPVTNFLVNAGMYVLNVQVLKYLDGGYCDMTDLFEKLMSQKCTTVACPIYEQWLDVGSRESLAHAETFVKRYLSGG